MKDLTIIIPIYNSEKYINRCLDSIKIQLKRSYELLLINDGSTDHSIKILRTYEASYPDIIRVIDKPNEGVAATRNLGIQKAQGQYICFVDNDDYVEPDYFETYLNAIRNSEYNLVIGGYRRTDDTQVKFEVKPVNSIWYPFTVPAPWAKIYKRSFLINNQIQFLNYKSGEDIYFNLAFFAKTNRIKVIPYIGYNWYYNRASVSNTVQRGFNQEIDIIFLMDQFYDIGKKDNIYFQYFYIRYLIWYLLFSGSTATKEDFMKEYHKLLGWLRDRNIPLRFPLFSKSTKGDRLSVKIEIKAFIIISKLHLMELFAFFYCRR